MPPPLTRDRRAFSLIEVVVALSVFMLVAAIAASLLINAMKFYRTSLLQSEMATRNRNLATRFSDDAAGCQFYQILDNYTDRQNALSGGTCLIMAQMDNMLNREPKIGRIICYYQDPAAGMGTGAQGPFHTLRRIDSRETPALWTRHEFPLALPSNQTLANLLPDAAKTLHAGRAITQIDSSQGRDTDGKYQLFYPIGGNIEVNLLTRFGNDSQSALAPIQLSILTRR